MVNKRSLFFCILLLIKINVYAEPVLNRCEYPSRNEIEAAENDTNIWPRYDIVQAKAFSFDEEHANIKKLEQEIQELKQQLSKLSDSRSTYPMPFLPWHPYYKY